MARKRKVGDLDTTEKERIALGLLIGAEWSERMHCFIRTIRGVSPYGIAWHDFEYYSAKGERIDKPKVPAPPFPGEGGYRGGNFNKSVLNKKLSEEFSKSLTKPFSEPL